ncbi:DUF2345 domain-containing protein, partial [Ralstonia solanacearum]
GLVAVAGQDLQFANGESLALASGQDTNVAVGKQARVHAGQGIGVAAGLSQAGDGNIGLQLTAGQDDIDVQAQHDALKLMSELDLKLVSANLNVDFAAAKRIRLATAEGASITLENGNITVECPGPITYKAAQRTFAGPVNQSYPLPAFPDQRIEDVPVHFNVNMQDVPGPSGAAIPLADWRIVKADGEFAALYSEDEILRGRSDAEGKMQLSSAEHAALQKACNEHLGQVWLVCESHAHRLSLQRESAEWDERQKRGHALNAMGYTDSYGQAEGAPQAEFHSDLSARETKLSSGDALLALIKNK